MYLTQPLHKASRSCPDALATVFGDRRQTYARFASRVATLAGALHAFGLEPGGRVGMLGMNSDRYVEYLYGVLWAGGVINPVNVRWSAREIAYSLDDCDTGILFVDDAFKEIIGPLREQTKALHTIVFIGEGECPDDAFDYETLLSQSGAVPDAVRRGDDLAAVLYTGGTTGKPKGVMLSHANLCIDGLATRVAVASPPESVALQTAPSFHVAGVQGIFSHFAKLGTLVILQSFEPGAVVETIEPERINDIFLVPTMLRFLLDHPDFAHRDLSSLTNVSYGASPMDTALLERALEALPGVEFSQAYGMTELSPTVSILTPHYHTAEGRAAGKLMSAGQPSSIAEMRIVDSNDEDVAPGAVGEIVARGPMVMQGYWNKPEQTAEALRNGWMHTGDAGTRDADGFIFVVDRMKDMIVSGGENVYSAEVEDAILQLPQVAQCAVIGVPDETWGERVHAVLVLKVGATLEHNELMAHCKTLIGGYKCPRSMEFRKEMPISGAGKLLKFELRAPYWRDHQRQVG